MEEEGGFIEGAHTDTTVLLRVALGLFGFQRRRCRGKQWEMFRLAGESAGVWTEFKPSAFNRPTLMCSGGM